MKLKLRQLRELRGWTQDEVASRTGISKSYYSEIESGKKAANSQRLQKFAEVFGVPTFELIEDSSIDSELLVHLRTMQSLSQADRKAVIRHALGLSDDLEAH
ncbi:helix-turn-helix domain-containing protein [Pseudogemmobacter faecipullorum]|uniref:Helix-turn-helix transcriptional regulator n=1 Tax=Pseudogemmobacter faecipullorum TaxID=2755041 RepID=A0ABS8CRZ2_9RHOB|nr:helix-turn-helix transcriptional regulator [Pseudogemmobacter faecipullorum]MCB5412162.1 helix-turn-helix transcriptional regulator [Pseudogemmobacter faecipullorum]